MAYKGKFIPKNPGKYRGNLDTITFRSLWERTCMMRFDSDPNVIEWSSEEVVIPYRNPVKSIGRDRPFISRYFVDFWIMYKDKAGIIQEALIEIKPFAQTQEPSFDKAHPRRSKKAIVTYAINKAKWTAATNLCEQRGWRFHIWTEKTLFGTNSKKNKTK